VRLQEGREKLSRSFHPWVFSGAILDSRPADAGLAAKAPAALPGIVRVCAADNGFIAWAQHLPGSKIALRLLEWREDRVPDAAWLVAGLGEAFARRLGGTGVPGLLPPGTDACRLVFSEADHLPGLIVEALGDWLVVQSENRVTDSWLDAHAAAITGAARQALPRLAGILERSDGDGRALEGLPPRTRRIWPEGAAANSLPDRTVTENGLRFAVDLLGQKAGFYTDQRDNRALVARHAAGRRVLDVCCYSGGFSAAAQVAGAASLCLVDASAQALDLARRNLELNPPAGDAPCPAEFIQGDAFQVLRELQGRRGAAGAPFDLVILDPPKLAPSRASLERALQGYKDLNLQAFKLLGPGGLLASFSCSGLVSTDDLRQAIAFAAKDAGIQVQILHHLHQAPCHPVLLSFPEGQYLKGFLLRVV
jgi:23S rRNA (cytosine1962-C5)-methyltransferase